MYDKTVRRRRAVLALLVVLSLILLTVYFGESAGGGLHTIQRGFLTVISPIQSGANKALKPVRDLFGWFGDTLHAKGQVKQLTKTVDQLRTQTVQYQQALRQNAEFRAMLHLDTQAKLSAYGPVTAQVIGRNPTVWYSTVNIDAGTNAGVHMDDPVVNGDGLVGKVTTVTSDGAQVTLITDSSSGVSAMLLGRSATASGATGIVQPAFGNPNDLLMQFVSSSENVQPGDNVVTSGTLSNQLDSLFPPDIPIGQVTSVDSSNTFKSIHVRPFASLHKLDYVQVLTRGTRGVHPTQAALAASSLPPPGTSGQSSQAGSGQTVASNPTGTGGGP